MEWNVDQCVKLFDSNETENKTGDETGDFVRFFPSFVQFQDKLRSHRHLITGNEPICQCG